MNQSKKLTDGALLTAIFMILLLLTIFVPIISIIAIFLLPIPFSYYTYKHNWKPAILMFAATIILSTLFFTLFSLPVTVLAGLGGIMLGVAIHQQLHPYETWARGSLGFVLGLLFIYIYTQLFMGVNWFSEIDNLLKESLQISHEMMSSLGVEQTEEELKAVESMMLQMKNLLPVGFVFIASIHAIISQWASYKVVNRVEAKQLKFPPFRTFKLPTAMIWIYFVAIVIAFFDLDTDSILYLGVQNVHVLIGLLITLQGFSFIFFYAHKKNISKALPIISVVVTLLFPFLFLYIIRVIGIVDIGFSLRDRIETGKK